MIEEVKCNFTGCDKPVKYARFVSGNVVAEYCATHGESFMRCKSGIGGQVGHCGECLWCDADSGEVCRAQR